MQLPSKTNWYFLLVGFGIAVVLFLFLSLKGCFKNEEYKGANPVYITDTVTVEIQSKPLTVYAKEIVIKWRTDTITNIINSEVSDALEFDTTFMVGRSVIVKQGKESHSFTDSSEVSLRAIVDCLLGRSLFSVSPLAYQSIEIPDKPISTYNEPFISLAGFGEFDLVNDKEWRIGIEIDFNLGALGIYTAPNVNPDNILALPVGATYTLWEN